MHILAIILGILGAGFWWALRLSAHRKNIGDAANMARGAVIQAKNMPRQRRFRKAHNKNGFDLVETPVEAAAVLMIMIARAGASRRIDESERNVIEAQLVTNMHLSADDADGTVRQMDSLTHDINLPESSITPMTKILREFIGRDDAKELAAMLEQVAAAEGESDINQTEFLRSFREGFDLN
ncbi:MAG: TerB family tellurite resistance protein [Litorimonas sp.]